MVTHNKELGLIRTGWNHLVWLNNPTLCPGEDRIESTEALNVSEWCSDAGWDTDLQTAFPAVLHDQTDIWSLNANAKELHQVLMFHLFHLSQKVQEVRHMINQVLSEARNVFKWLLA